MWIWCGTAIGLVKDSGMVCDGLFDLPRRDQCALFDGTLEVESEGLGQGAKFTARFKVDDCTAAAV